MKAEECQIGLEVYFVNWFEGCYGTYEIKHDEIAGFDTENASFYSEGYDGWAGPVSLDRVFLTEKEAAIYLQSIIPQAMSECLDNMNKLNEAHFEAQEIIEANQ
jgi:hypothetical protein